MRSHWWRVFDGMEEMAFKRVPEGWVYGAPKSWLFGPARFYILDERQKSAVAAHVRRMWRLLFTAILVFVTVAVPIALSGLDRHPIAMLAAAVAIGLAVGFACNAYLSWAIRSIIAGLEPTTQRITQREAFNTQVAAFSRGRLMFFGMLSFAMFALGAARPLFTSDSWDLWSVAATLLFGTGAVYWFMLYAAKRRHSA